MVLPVLPRGYTAILPTSGTAGSTLSVHTVVGGGTDTVGGVVLGALGAAAPLQWTGSVTSADPAGFTSYAGRNGTVIGAAGLTLPTNPDLLVNGFDQTGGIAISLVQGGTANVASTLSLGFSAALPTGSAFALWDPGVSVNGTSPTATYTFNATAAGATVSTAGWTVSAYDPFTGVADAGTYAFNAATGTLTVTNYASGNDPSSPQKVLIVTPNNAVDHVSVAAQSAPGDVFGLDALIPATQSGPTAATVIGAGGTTLSIPFATARDATGVAPFFAGLAASVAGGTATVSAAGSGTTTLTGASYLEATTAISAGLGAARAFITTATGQTTLAGGTATNASVIAGLGGLSFTAGASTAAGGGIHVGGGNSLFYAGSVAGNWSMRFSAGNNTVVAASGADTIDSGNGNNLAFLGTGNSIVTSEGTDTVIGGAGISTVQSIGPGALVFAGSGGLAFTAASGVSTIAGSTAAETLVGGSGRMLAFGFGPTSYTGGSGADTIVGISSVPGALSVVGGSGNGLYFGASGGGNQIFGGTGSATILGGGAGDVLSTGGSGTNVVVAGAGAETVDGSRSSGTNTFFLGSGTEFVRGGSGANAIQIGTGAETINSAGSNDLYVLYNLGSTSRTALINGFNPAHDFIKLNGFTGGAAVVVETPAAGGGTLVSLPDGTQITFAGISQVPAANFV